MIEWKGEMKGEQWIRNRIRDHFRLVPNRSSFIVSWERRFVLRIFHFLTLLSSIRASSVLINVCRLPTWMQMYYIYAFNSKSLKLILMPYCGSGYVTNVSSSHIEFHRYLPSWKDIGRRSLKCSLLLSLLVIDISHHRSKIKFTFPHHFDPDTNFIV